MNAEQFEKMRSGAGFIAALDQSGGSTPKALRLYGIDEDQYSTEAEMFDLVHQMRTRIMTSPVFNGDRVIAAILFEDTMDREIDGQPTADYLWNVKRIVPILKVDKGLQPENEGAQLMKRIPGLEELLERATGKHIFGTKMRSLIKLPGHGVEAVVAQQFEFAKRILAAGLVPIIEPEIDIHSPGKAEAEEQLRAAIEAHLKDLGPDEYVMFKLTPPEEDDYYADLVAHPNVLRVVFLSGGYSRDEANARLARNHGVVASFSRALTQGLTVQQSDEEFDALLDESIASIFAASAT
ncbi:MAG: fructose bisphosphate aldolase [Actinomycetales bacterium]|nr:fructose bisphosphate aldolase [Actinomycetales bacterium]